MNLYKLGLLTTFLLGIFILIGAIISLLVSKREKIEEFSIGLAFGVITTLIVSDLLPEAFDIFHWKRIYLLVIFSLLGFGILKVLDHFVPDHHEEHKLTKKESKSNLTHIGVVTTYALILHNILEGMAIYSTTLTNSTMTVPLALGIGFHNIPLGMVIASSMYHTEKDKKKTYLSIIFVSLSTFVGGLIMYLFHLNEINDLAAGILLSITLGMLFYIVIDELFPRIKKTKDKKTAFMGIGIGILILCIAFFIGK